MQNKKYTSICDIISKQLKKKIFPFMTLKEVKLLKDNSNIYQFPIQSFYKNNQRKKKG